MKSKFTGITSVLICLIIISFSCQKKDKEITYYTSGVNEEAATKFFFNPGSYWVYEDQSGQLDSVFVTGVERNMTEIPCPNSCPGGVISRTEYLQMNLFSSFENSLHNFYLTTGNIRYNGGGEYGQNGQPIFVYNQSIGYEFNGATIVGEIDTLTLSGNTYLNVTKMKISEASQYEHQFDHDTELYFAENVGLIKKEIVDPINGNKVWTLLQYHVQ